MKNTLTLIRQHWLKAATLALIAYALAFHVEYDELGRTFASVSWRWVVLAIIANLASIMLKVASWKIIFDYTFKGIRGRWRDLTSALMIGFFVNLLIPARVGELARAFVISRRQTLLGKPVSRSTVFGTIVLERVFDGIVFALIVVYGVFRLDLPSWANTGAIILLVISGALAAVLVTLEIKREKIKKTAEKAKAVHKEHHSRWRKMATRFYGVVARFSEGQKVLRSPVRIAAIFITTSASWMSQLMAVFLSLHAFHLVGDMGSIGGADGFMNAGGIKGALLLLILINVAGALPATPGNVGVFQLATVIPLTVTYGISKTTALAFSVGLQVIEGSIGLGVGGACLLREGLNFKQVRSGARELEEEVEEEKEQGRDKP
ncbi:MAG: lysylphosphatidylglycerol synthase transmembrane domain-containing protein [Thermoleophilia bacterium]